MGCYNNAGWRGHREVYQMKTKKILECTMIGVSIAAMTAVVFGNIEFLASSSINLVGAIILHYIPDEGDL